MFILGLQGSPRKEGNSDTLLDMFMTEAEGFRADTAVIRPGDLDLKPCRELTVCEREGYCPINDDMNKRIYPLVKTADIIVIASPVFFYGIPAQIKALVDRCQMFWSRKYKLNLKHPNAKKRKGLLLACGASGGKRLFDGVELTCQYFFDAVSAEYEGALTYRGIEKPGEMSDHATAREDIAAKVNDLCGPFLKRKNILFVSRNDACRSQMAAAFFRLYDAGDFNVFTAGPQPAPEIYPETVEVMAERHLDVKYRLPSALNAINRGHPMDIVVSLGSSDYAGYFSDADNERIEIDIPEVKSVDTFRVLRDEIHARVKSLNPLQKR